MNFSGKIRPVASISFLFIFLLVGFVELAEARARGGGRSLGQQRSVSRPAAQPRQPAAQQQAPVTQPGRPGGLGTGLAGGLAGGLMGGMIGSMLFGGMAHGSGAGGMGGSGIGLIEILLLGGAGYFIYRRFLRRPSSGANSDNTSQFDQSSAGGRVEALDAPPESSGGLPDANLVAGVKQIWEVDNNFDPEAFKEIAQDLFFKIQAAWTQRRVDILTPFVGEQLLAEYDAHFNELRQQGRINRLENIAVRKVDLLDAGVEDQEIFVVVRFTANLLEYTVDEKSGDVIEGDADNPVKFQEDWTFAKSIGVEEWKLEGIEA